MLASINKNSSVPIYIQLAEILKAEIDSGSYPTNSLLPSENKLAKEYSVSRMTARSTLKLLEREKIIVCDSTKGRVVAGSCPSVDRSFTVGVYPFNMELISESSNYHGEVLNGLSSGSLGRPVKFKYVSRKALGAANCSMTSYLHRERIDALLWMGAHDADLDEMRKIKNAGFPVLLFNVEIPGSGLDYISCDHFQGGNQLMDSLVAMGHRRIACVSVKMDTHPFAIPRWRAYKEAHSRYGLEFRRDWTIEVGDWIGDDNPSLEFKKSLNALLIGPEPPTAIFATSGHVAERALEIISRYDFKTPSDVSFVAYDEVFTKSELKVTCVRQGTETMAEIAVGVLLNKIRNINSEQIQICMSPTFIPGNSCAFYGD